MLGKLSFFVVSLFRNFTKNSQSPPPRKLLFAQSEPSESIKEKANVTQHGHLVVQVKPAHHIIPNSRKHLYLGQDFQHVLNSHWL